MSEVQTQQPQLATPTGFRMQEFGLLVVLALLMAALTGVGFFNNPAHVHWNTFLNARNLIEQVAGYMSVYAIMAVGLTLVIITGGIDISVGSTFALCSLATAWALQDMDVAAPAWKVMPVAFLVPLLVGGICGLINGLLIITLRLHPFIVTLGTMSIFRCMANVLPGYSHGAKSTTLPLPGLDLPDVFTKFIQWDFGVGLRFMPLVAMLLCALVGWIFMSFTVAGRETYAVGGNEEAARFSGLRVGWIKCRVYIITGLLAGVAGIMNTGEFGGAYSNTGQGYELNVIAAAVVGGASLTGGRGTALGAILGALVIRLIENGIAIVDINKEFSIGIIGAAIIIAAALDQFSVKTRGR